MGSSGTGRCISPLEAAQVTAAAAATTSSLKVPWWLAEPLSPLRPHLRLRLPGCGRLPPSEYQPCMAQYCGKAGRALTAPLRRSRATQAAQRLLAAASAASGPAPAPPAPSATRTARSARPRSGWKVCRRPAGCPPAASGSSGCGCQVRARCLCFVGTRLRAAQQPAISGTSQRMQRVETNAAAMQAARPPAGASRGRRGNVSSQGRRACRKACSRGPSRRTTSTKPRNCGSKGEGMGRVGHPNRRSLRES
jgi:hypothetical protein